ncbi:hypothetical protein D1AOALGA4SA_4804 [Olavius algarvensis Delta 1 endosymbiont]|nr:hypothetical protein D1AOALGA4SA_4804 [Olavius algarvensis Delta 1 endosymbiont]
MKAVKPVFEDEAWSAIEHNAGHHRTVATPEDPATVRKNES